MQSQNREGGLEAAGSTQRMSGHGLGGTHRQFVGMVTEHGFHRQGLTPVIERRGGAMSVDVIDLVRVQAGIAQGRSHAAGRTLAILGRGGDVVGVTGLSIADDLGVNGGAPLACGFQFLEHEHARTLGDDKSVPIAIERS